jgi:hypothetical protein
MQGDQIGRIFACLALAYFGHFLKITEVTKLFCPLLHGKIYVFILTKKWDRATFWATFTQTHLVTLPACFKTKYVNWLLATSIFDEYFLLAK